MKQVNSTSSIQHWETVTKTSEEVLERLQQSPPLYQSYQSLNSDWRQRFVDFCTGKKTLPLTYDPIFKRIFHPDIHPDRLSNLISAILCKRVHIIKVLPNEDSVLTESSLLLMDLLAELEDGSLVNIEIQKQGYAFPAERISCYSSDLVMRQYARIKGEKGKHFKYLDIKKVYMIVMFERSPQMFHDNPEIFSFIHYGKTVFDTALPLELLQEYCLIALDEFRSFPYDKNKSDLVAWISLLCTENLEDAEKLIQVYPWLEDIYQEIALLRQNPEEVLNMFSESLRILDENTVKYMIDEMQKEIDDLKADNEKKNTILKDKDAQLNAQALKIKELEEQLNI